MKDTGTLLKLGSWRELNWLLFVTLELGEFINTTADVESGSLLHRPYLHTEQAHSLRPTSSGQVLGVRCTPRSSTHELL